MSQSDDDAPRTGRWRLQRRSGRGRVLGVDDMVEVAEARLANARSAERMIAAARGTERHFLAEPDDARLEQMLQRLSEVLLTLEDDCSRWAAVVVSAQRRTQE